MQIGSRWWGVGPLLQNWAVKYRELIGLISSQLLLESWQSYHRILGRNSVLITCVVSMYAAPEQCLAGQMNLTHLISNFWNDIELSTTSSEYFGTWSIPSVDGEQTTTVQIDASYQLYKYCNQNLLDSGSAFAFPSLPSFQPEDAKWMEEDQETISEIHAWTCVAILGAIAMHYSKSLYQRCTRTYKVRV
jgi:hypothetical protein